MKSLLFLCLVLFISSSFAALRQNNQNGFQAKTFSIDSLSFGQLYHDEIDVYSLLQTLNSDVVFSKCDPEKEGLSCAKTENVRTLFDGDDYPACQFIHDVYFHPLTRKLYLSCDDGPVFRSSPPYTSVDLALNTQGLRSAEQLLVNPNTFDIFVSDRFGCKIYYFKYLPEDDNYALPVVISSAFLKPFQLAHDSRNGDLYAAFIDSNVLVRLRLAEGYSWSDGENFVTETVIYGSPGEETLLLPHGVAVDEEMDRLYVSSYDGHYVLCLQPTSSLAEATGPASFAATVIAGVPNEAGQDLAHLFSPLSLILHQPSHTLYVNDRSNHRILALSFRQPVPQSSADVDVRVFAGGRGLGFHKPQSLATPYPLGFSIDPDSFTLYVVCLYYDTAISDFFLKILPLTAPAPYNSVGKCQNNVCV